MVKEEAKWSKKDSNDLKMSENKQNKRKILGDRNDSVVILKA